MGADRPTPTRDPPITPVPVEVLHESERTRVTREFLAGGSVIRKEPLGPDAKQRLHHESAILELLRGVDGVVQLVSAAPGESSGAGGLASPDNSMLLEDNSMLLEDIDGVSLAHHRMPLEATRLCRLSLDLARAVAQVHRRQVIHRDIHPDNILVSRTRQTPYLVDFALATTFAEIRPQFAHHSEIVGNLAYLAPEQTGRTGRPVDQRADLYSLGATLYELATGQPPFGTSDPLRLSYEHLARVPEPPNVVNPAIPPIVSQIIMRLLEKEPDRRYQTADGLVDDLTRLTREGADLAAVSFPVGSHDFPLRLLAPSRLVGRDAEIAALSTALADAAAGDGRCVLVSGGPGTGKSALIDQLRPMVTASDGWFIAGNFDRYRKDQEFDALWQGFRRLGRLLLAEPEEELGTLRQRMLEALGPNAGLMAALHPSYGTLLGIAPDQDAGDPLTVEARLNRIAIDVLRVVASRKRPLVFAVDDIQWAGRTPLGFVDTVLGGGEEIAGLLLVVTCRDDEVDTAHPLAAMLERWHHRPDPPRHIRLGNLPLPALTQMVGDMLRLDPEQAGQLAQTIAPHTNGNPYETVELLNTLRHDGVITAHNGECRWDEAALRGRLSGSALDELLAERAAGMPTATAALLHIIACLGATVNLAVLQAASGTSASTVEHRLAPALNNGLLVMEADGQQAAVRFRHERVQQAVLSRLGQSQERTLRLQVARRLGRRPELFAVAAEQYLPVVEALTDPAERARVAALLAKAAAQAQMLSNDVVVQRCLAAAIGLTDTWDRDTLIRLLTARHTALYRLGRLDETDELYRTIDQLCTEPEQRTDATLVQVSSLFNRERPRAAVDLGLAQLAQLGVPVPAPEQLDAEIGRRLTTVDQWADAGEGDDVQQAENTDPALRAVAALVNRMMPPSFACDQAVMAWLALEAIRLWRERGPNRALVAPMTYLAFVLIARRQDYRTAHRVMARILAVSRARGYEAETSQAQSLYASSVGPWFDPLEENVAWARRAREELIAGGDLQSACYSYLIPVLQGVEYVPTLGSYVQEVEAALGFARRTRNDQVAGVCSAYRRLVRDLRREAPEPADNDAEQPNPQGATPPVVVTTHLTHGLTAALLGDDTQLFRHTEAVMSLLPSVPGSFQSSTARVLRAIAVASRIRAGARGERRSLLAELDATMDWLAARAADAPGNFLHLLRFLEAERAWAVGDFRAAAHAFDVALREAASRQRPWHRALIFEHAARLYIAQGLEHVGHVLLGEARREYLAWGAAAKVDRLDWAYPTLQHAYQGRSAGAPGADYRSSTGRSSTMAGAIDLLGILAASQALSSEKSIDQLRTRVVEVLSAMTGATGVQMLVWNEDERRWFLAPPRGRRMVPLADAGRRRLVPLSAVRYAERTRETLVVVDASRDDRFARDPYFAGMECCSLLVVPVVNRGAAQALLLLENRLIRGAFSTERLDSVMLIAAQLAVSLDNAMVYASLERKVAERTEELALANELLRLANERLEQLSVTDPLTGLANRRQLEEVLDAEWRRAHAVRSPISLLMMDIDHFKLYNDHYGHAAGDRCLQHVATQVRQNVRKVDLAARYGGEEFAVVMPGTDVTGAVEAAERLRNAVAALGEPHELVAEKVITVSIGVAAMVPPPNCGADHLAASADVELYRAKRSGRNRVQVASPGASCE